MASDLTAYVPGMDYGVGVNSLNGSARGDAVIRTPSVPVEGASGQRITFLLDKIEKVEDLQSSLGISVEASASYGLFSGSARFSFAERCKFHAYSIFLLVHTSVANEFRRMRDVELKPGAVELMRSGNRDRFWQQCGDMFVLGLQTGGEFFAVLEIKTQTASEQRELKASLDAGGKFGLSFNVKSEFEKAINKVTENRSLKVVSYQEGGEMTDVPTDVEGIVKRATEFASRLAGGKGVPYAVQLQDYGALDWPVEPNFIDLQSQRDALVNIARQRNAHVNLLNNIDFILTNQDQFEGVDVDTLNNARNQLAGNINQMTRAASRCVGNITQCDFPQYSVPEVRLPKRREALSRSLIPLFDLAPNATWITGQLVDEHNMQNEVALPWNGPKGDSSGFANVETLQLEDGTTEAALFTHPQWVGNGTIKGWLPWVKLTGAATFEAEVGFANGALDTDGVTFWVWEHHRENGQEVWNPVVQVTKQYSGNLEPVRADLSRLAGQEVGFELRVDAGPSSGQDWAVWVRPRILIA